MAEPRPNSARWSKLAALEAAGALTPAERADFERLLLDATEEERRVVADLREVAVRLATAAPAKAPAGLRERLAAAIAVKTQQPPAPTSATRRVEHVRPGFYSLLRDQTPWEPTGLPGVAKKELTVNRDQNYAVLLVRMAAGANYPAHDHGQAEECFVVAGDVLIEGRRLQAGDFHHAERGTRHSPVSTEGGCTVMLVVSAIDYA